MALSVVARPLAGVLADRWERRLTAATGALLYAVSCAGYALAESAPLACGAAVGSLVAGALHDGAHWWVACVVAGGMILAGAVVVPRAVRLLGVPDVPVTTA
ncbi:hypothetical protein [Saccharothrix sp. HUAS TT10]